MSNIVEIRDSKGRRLAYKIGRDLSGGLRTYSRDEDSIQVLSWNYPMGKTLQAHIHSQWLRIAEHTQEAIIVMSGRVRADVYDQKHQRVTEVEVDSGECMVFLEGGHGYEILQDGTKIFEIKNGPYPGLDADKVKF
jgi:hypothetical protein